MAIIDEFPGLKITVQVDGQDAVEYDDPDGFEDDTNRRDARWRTFSYVESKDDAFFSVRYQVDNSHLWESPNHGLGLYLFVDGKRLDDVVCEAQSFLNNNPFHVWDHIVRGSRGSPDASGLQRLNLFKFSKVTTTDDAEKDRIEVDKAKAKSLGVIQVLVYPIAITGTSRHISAGYPGAENDGFEIAEKALKGKAVSHGTSFADGGTVASQRALHVEYLNNRNPLAAFSFKYRSRDALHQELIIPRSPSPEPIDGLSEAEIRRLAAERLKDINNRNGSPIAKREGQRSTIKREYAEILDLTEEPAKREWKKVKIEGNRVAIDLTDD